MRPGRWKQGRHIIIASQAVEADVCSSQLTPRFSNLSLWSIPLAPRFLIHIASCPPALIWFPMLEMEITNIWNIFYEATFSGSNTPKYLLPSSLEFPWPYATPWFTFLIAVHVNSSPQVGHKPLEGRGLHLTAVLYNLRRLSMMFLDKPCGKYQKLNREEPSKDRVRHSTSEDSAWRGWLVTSDVEGEVLATG